MNLAEQVSKIKKEIFQAFDKKLLRLGIGKDKMQARREDDKDFSRAEAAINALQEQGLSYKKAREQYLDEAAFTFFNRIAGIKVMESETRKLMPEIIQIRARHGDKSFAHNTWLEEHPSMSSETLEGLGRFLRDKFNEFSKNLPLYSLEYPYDLMPEIHDLKDIIVLFNNEISLEEWRKDDILGWLYEAYNKKDYKEFKESGDKIEWDKLSLSSQMYTPRWVVEFLVNNSLGKYWLEVNPISQIKDNHDIANAPSDPVIDKKIEEVKVIDPAAGSGNFLLYAFDLLSEIYEEEGYDREEIPNLILNNNLFGLDIDERAVQIARLQLYIKAKSYSRSSKVEDINVASANFHLPQYEKVEKLFNINIEFAANEEGFLEELWNELRDAHKFGSLLTLEETLDSYFKDKKEGNVLGLFDNVIDVENLEVDVLNKLRDVVIKTNENGFSKNFIKHQSLEAIKFAEIMLGVNKRNGGYEVEKYDIAVTNPPYTDSDNYGENLKKFVGTNYKKPKKFHKNLYASFLKKNSEFINENGKIAMINPDTFMTIKSFEDVRKYILDELHINIFAHYPTSGIFNIGVIYPTLYVLEKNNYKNKSIFLDFRDKRRNNEEEKNVLKVTLKDFVLENSNEKIFTLEQNKLKIIDSYPIIYWISDSFRQKFKEEKLDEICHIGEGLKTNNNLRFLNYWWEIFREEIREDYYLHTKGGQSNKWYGNNWLAINYKENGRYLEREGASLTNNEFYFKKGITYGKTSSTRNSFRLLEKDVIFDSQSPSIFIKEGIKISECYVLGLLNSKLSGFISQGLNPTIATQVGDIKRIPFVKFKHGQKTKVGKFTKENISNKKEQCKFDIIEREFEHNPMIQPWLNGSLNIEDRLKTYINFKYNLDCQILLNEAIIDELIFEVYELTESDREMVLDQEGIPEGLLPVLKGDRGKFIKNNELQKEVIDFINNLSIETKRSRVNLKDNVNKLHKKNKSVQEIAKELELNPISVVEIIKEFDFYPKKLAYQKAHEFILDLTREILMENEDGIVMVNEYAGEDPLNKKIIDKLFAKKFSSGDVDRLENMLGKKIKGYLLDSFFSDECNTLNLLMFQPKTPFIWHLTSGKEHGFDAYIIIYRWNRDKILKIKSYYLDKRRTGLNNRLNNLADDDSAAAEKEKDRLRKQLQEVEGFEDKLDELLSSGYDPELDDGVGKNIAPLQELGLIADDVLTNSQLEKFLNADW